ncbi:transposase [Paenibacillus sp. 481]|uniref:transposase n=1 Tax=Paenibacillus sp. 481 TaxID=2835869 RepID=UPI003FA6D8EF
MMHFYEDTNRYLKVCDSEQSLRELRKNAWQFLNQVDEQLSSQYPRTDKPSLCPRCRSRNTKKNGQKQKRYRCLDCSRTYDINLDKPHIFHHKHHPEKMLNLIFLIYKTNKSTAEILDELDLSRNTYYKWKKEVLIVLPFLAPYFVKRH